MKFLKNILAVFYNHIGFKCEKKHNYIKSLKFYNLSTRMDPTFAMAYYNKGNLFTRLEQYDKAIRNYNEAINLNPGYSEAYNNIGRIFIMNDQTDLAVNYFIHAITLNPKNAEAYSNLGTLYLNREDYDQSIELFTNAIRCNTYKKYSFFYNRGIAHGKKGDIGKSIEDFSESIELNSTFPDAYYNRAIAFEINGQQNKAKVDRQIAERLESLSKKTKEPPIKKMPHYINRSVNKQ